MKIGLDYIGVSAGAAVINGEGKYFLAKRSAGARDDQGCWEFPGGTIHFNETREQAAVRNISEKYGLEIRLQKLLDTYDVIDKQAGDHWISTTFLAGYVGGEPMIANPEKCSDIGWFSLGEIKALELSRITKLNVQDLTRLTSST
jgi:8-oxo-dGTP diphosphatase